MINLDDYIKLDCEELGYDNGECRGHYLHPEKMLIYSVPRQGFIGRGYEIKGVRDDFIKLHNATLYRREIENMQFKYKRNSMVSRPNVTYIE